MEGFTHQKIARVMIYRSTMANIGHSSEAEYKDMVRSNMICHCPIIPSDINANDKIF